MNESINNKTRYKYIHIFYRNEIKFNGIILDMINDPENGFEINNHLFVAPYKKLYDLIKDYPNVLLDECTDNLINKYAPQAEVVIAHSYKNVKDFLFATNRNLNKVVYRYWGGGILPFRYKKSESIKNILKKVLNKLFKYRLSKMKSIGIANVVDEIDIRKTLQDVQLNVLQYVDKKYAILDTILGDNSEISKHNMNVMIGHRGGVEGNHINLLKALEHFGDQITVFLPLSYGDTEYIKQVKNFIQTYKACKVIVLDNFMEFNEYVQTLNTMDVCLFDGQYSYALGNISIILALRKKIYLNSKGALAEAFDHEHVPYFDVSELNMISFEDFSRPVIYDTDSIKSLCALDYASVVRQWKDVLTN